MGRSGGSEGIVPYDSAVFVGPAAERLKYKEGAVQVGWPAAEAT